WLSTFYTLDHLLILKPFIDILSTAINIKNTEYETKKDRKQLKKINLPPKKWSVMKDIMPILKQFAKAIEKLEESQYLTMRPRHTYLVKKQQKNFCILSKLARKYFAIQATSATSEKLFSDAGNIITSKRTSLKLE
ncbi:3661_t:CDS:2, partial [Racocetra persica]